ncbi:MAG: hypothetical protein ACYTHJ_05090 [Planctomycetota bacterium]|jgi:hypothetical protein
MSFRQAFSWGGLGLFLSVSAVFSAPPELSRIHGEQLDASKLGPGIVESMDVVIARDEARQARAARDNSAKANVDRRFGEWVVPSRRGSTAAYSGEHYIINKWGDTRMGIGFPELVDVHGVYIAGQMAAGVWTTGVRVIGYADDREVARTEWYRHIGENPIWFEIDLCKVDRIEFQSEAVVKKGGWYAIDDLTYSPVDDSDRALTVVDFDDLNYHKSLSGTDYAGLFWEFGTGFNFDDLVPAPKVPPGMDDKPQPRDGDADGGQGAVAGGLGTLPALLGQFQGVIRGDGDSFSYPPDTCGAVGTDHYVIVVNRVFAVYDKFTGEELISVNLASFQPGTNGDPRVLFDQHSMRWIVLSTNFSGGEDIFIAVSLTDSATGAWFKTSFDTAQESDSDNWPDYPTLGVDENGIYTASYMVPGGMSIFAIDKAPMVAPTPTLGTVTAWRDLPYENAIQPVHTYGSPEGEYLVSTASNSAIRLRRINPPLTEPTMSELGFIEVPPFSAPPNAPAQGSTTPINTIDRRLMMSVYRDGSVWTAHTVEFANAAAARWYQLDVSDLSVTQLGTVQSAVFYYYFPSIMVNKLGQVAMGFSGSSPNTYVNAYYTGRNPQDPAGQMGPATIYRFGLAPQNNIDSFGRNRWGDYSYTTLDPVDEVTFYSLQEYAHQPDIWGTEVAIIDGGDCNASGLEDPCDISCGVPGGECDQTGCGQSEDCNANLLPDECESIIGACCLPDGGCCNYVTETECIDSWGSFNGLGSDCAPVGPACEVATARINLVADVSNAYPGGLIPVEVFVADIEDLASYQVAIQTEPASGSGDVSLDCSSCTGGPNEPACATRVNESRPDYVFSDESPIAAVSCGVSAVGGILITGGVDVDPAGAYAGEFTLSISQDATPGSEFEISINPSNLGSTLQMSTGDFVPYLTGPSTVVTLLDAPPCESPVAIGDGSRTILATPIAPQAQALLVTGSPGNADVACVNLYVQADGTLGPDPVFQTAEEWGTASIRGEEIIPSATYLVQSDCGSPGAPQLSGVVAATTWVWGDVDSPPNNLVNFADIQLVVQAFQLNFENVTLERADLEPCLPNRVANFADVLLDVQAFQGQLYSDTGCGVPCP